VLKHTLDSFNKKTTLGSLHSICWWAPKICSCGWLHEGHSRLHCLPTSGTRIHVNHGPFQPCPPHPTTGWISLHYASQNWSCHFCCWFAWRDSMLLCMATCPAAVDVYTILAMHTYTLAYQLELVWNKWVLLHCHCSELVVWELTTGSLTCFCWHETAAAALKYVIYITNNLSTRVQLSVI